MQYLFRLEIQRKRHLIFAIQVHLRLLLKRHHPHPIQGGRWGRQQLLPCFAGVSDHQFRRACGVPLLTRDSARRNCGQVLRVYGRSVLSSYFSQGIAISGMNEQAFFMYLIYILKRQIKEIVQIVMAEVGLFLEVFFIE